MSSLKNAFVAGIFAVSGAVSAQEVPRQLAIDDTKNTLYTVVSDSTQTKPVDATMTAEYVNPVALSKNAMPTFQNPREGSLIHQLQNNGLTEGYYRYRQNAFVEVKFKMKGDKTRIVVKIYQLTDEDYDFGAGFPTDRIVLDGYGHYLPRNPYSSDQAWLFESFFVSTPLSYVGPIRPMPVRP